MTKLNREELAADLMANAEAIVVEHPLLVEMEAKINALIRVGERSIDREKQCMPLIAKSGCGKSTILRHCVRKLNAGRDVESGEIPALFTTLSPAIGKKSLAQDILIALQKIRGRTTDPEIGNETILFERTTKYLREARSKILIIDEFQHVLLSDTEKRKKAVGETIKWLLIEGPCPVVVSGTDKAWGPFKDNVQLMRRAVSSVNLRPLDRSQRADREWFGRFFGQYFATIERLKIASDTRELTLDDTLSRLMEASGGVIGVGCKIISHAIYEMAIAGRTEIVEQDFRIACDKLLLHGFIGSNPFETGSRGMKISAAA
jgi:hypothetical protein